MLAAALWGCGNCEDEEQKATAFLGRPQNLACATTDDCVVVQTGCANPKRSFCGQAQLNRDAASSTEWRELEADLSNCESSCSQCAALLIASCQQGSCGGP